MTDELISKKSLLKNLDLVISEYKAQYSWKCDGVIVSILTSVRDLVSSKPIVYDIDKVIEQLEELGKEHPYKVLGQPDTYSQYKEAWQDCIDRVLGIVKKGGVGE